MGRAGGEDQLVAGTIDRPGVIAADPGHEQGALLGVVGVPREADAGGDPNQPAVGAGHRGPAADVDQGDAGHRRQPAVGILDPG